MKVKTSDLQGKALDYCVARCEGFLCDWHYARALAPYSSDWSQGGPIIEREIQEIYRHSALECWAAKHILGVLRYGTTPLIAAMRCYVASKLGDVVDVPDELMEE